MSQIRIQRSPELDKVLTHLRSKYRLLSEAEIIKMVLSERYYQEKKQVEDPAWSVIDRIQARNADKDPDEVLRDVTEEVEAVRQTMYDQEKTPGSR